MNKKEKRMSEKKIEVIRNKIISIENYPKEGVVFKDILPILNDYTAMSYVLDLFEEHYKQITFTKIVGTEARVSCLACRLHKD